MLYNKQWEYKINPVSQVLLTAADLLEKHGHIKYIRKDPNSGSMCLLGALSAAQNFDDHLGYDTPLTYQAAEAIVNTLGLTVNAVIPTSIAQAVADWNNAPDRTAAEVIAVMRKAAKENV